MVGLCCVGNRNDIAFIYFWYPLYGVVVVVSCGIRMVACLNVVLLITMVGCGQKNDGDQTPTTSINGQDGTPASKDGKAAAATTKTNFDPKNPVVVMETSLGKITIRLNAEKGSTDGG